MPDFRLESMAAQLEAACTDLGRPNPALDLSQGLYIQDKRLVDLSQKVVQTAQTLQAETMKLSIQGPHSKRKAFAKTFKTLRQKGPIDEIQRKLEHYQAILDTLILTNLRQRVHLLSERQTEGFQNLDGKVQNLISAVAQGMDTFEDIKSLLAATEASTKQHISTEFEKERARMIAEDYRDRLLDSLYFPEIHVRQEEIKEAHKETFHWIFDETGEALRPWTNFAEWLRAGQGTYFVLGKAGSGKSTLMNTIHQDERTANALKAWSGSLPLITPAFFFWKAGSELQKTSIGMLRALLHSIISSLPSEANLLSILNSLNPHNMRQLPLWTERRLVTSLIALVRDISSSFRLCIFVDGLDEFSGDETILLSLIEQLSQLPNNKLCVSSRPSLRIEEKLGSAMLRLQDLTKIDIERHALSQLTVAASQAPRERRQQGWPRSTAETIVNRAEGVFLWAELAVKHQSEGLYNGDDDDKLEDRLDAFPSELEDVYLFMLQRIDKVYRAEVAMYLWMAMKPAEFLRLRQTALASYDGLDDLLALYPNHAAVSLQNLCLLTRRRIAATCKGLLEVQEHPGQLCLSRVAFVHRTAADFLVENESGQKFFGETKVTEAKSLIMRLKADLATLVLDDRPGPSDESDDRDSDCLNDSLTSLTENILHDLRLCEEATGEAFPDSIDLLHRIWSSPDRWGAPLPLNNPWHNSWSTKDDGAHWLAHIEGIRESWAQEDDSAGGRADVENISNDTKNSDDFLVIAASYGLRHYVLNVLDSCPTLSHPWIETYLLQNLCLFTRLYRLEDPHFRLIAALLERGGSANARVGEGTTVWTRFLTEFLFSCGDWSSVAKREVAHNVFLAFHENGVDVLNGVPWKWDDMNIYMKGPAEGRVLKVISAEWRVWPRMFMEHFRSGDEIVADRERSACTTITVLRPDIKTDGYQDKTVYHLSTQQSDRLLKAWRDVDLDDWWCARRSFGVELEKVVSELYQASVDVSADCRGQGNELLEAEERIHDLALGQTTSDPPSSVREAV